MTVKCCIDAHIHLDLYEPRERDAIVQSLSRHNVQALVAVSRHLQSCQITQELHRSYPDQVLPAYGFHPEQPIPSPEEVDQLFAWIRQHQQEMVAVGEVGLPYYNRHEAEQCGETFDIEPYVHLLEQFVLLAVELDKPIVLHAVYEDADIACNLLEKHHLQRAHFHWFKGAPHTVERMMRNGYLISFTPDIVYESEIQQLAAMVPLEQTMVETDGPWPFEGPFHNQMTHPRMIHAIIEQLAAMKGVAADSVADILYRNTMKFYRDPLSRR